MEELEATSDEDADPVGSEEALYQEARRQLRAPRPVRMTGLLFLVLFLVFVGGQVGELQSATGIAVLIAVLLFHEAGHAAGMRLFGFRDVRMFFIPFFGAAVSGRARGAAAWKEAIVSLLGPVPGILLGVVLYFVMQRRPSALMVTVVQSLLFLNAFNLLPLGFLDGGRFFERILFSRHRVLAVAAQALGLLSLAILGGVGSMWLLAGFAAIGLFALPMRWRVLKASAAIRSRYPALSPDPERLADEEERAVFAAARSVLRRPGTEQPGTVASTMESILEGVKRAPGVLATLGLAAIYCVGIVCGVLGIVAVALDTRGFAWRTFEQPGWRVDFPQSPLHVEDGHRWRAVVEGTQRFSVSIEEDGSEGEGWMDEAARGLAETTGLPLIESKVVEFSGHPGREFHFAAERREARARMIAVGGKRYELVTSAPALGENHARFLDSFKLVPVEDR